jgi:hypothetical protein
MHDTMRSAHGVPIEWWLDPRTRPSTILLSRTYRVAGVGEVGEDASSTRILLSESRIDDDDAERVIALERHLEALGEEYQRGGIGVLASREELGERAPAEPQVEQCHEGSDEDIRRGPKTASASAGGTCPLRTRSHLSAIVQPILRTLFRRWLRQQRPIVVWTQGQSHGRTADVSQCHQSDWNQAQRCCFASPLCNVASKSRADDGEPLGTSRAAAPTSHDGPVSTVCLLQDVEEVPMQLVFVHRGGCGVAARAVDTETPGGGLNCPACSRQPGVIRKTG